MKRVILLTAGLLLVVNTANALVVTKSDEHHKSKKWNCDEPISFMERGIEFIVFPNGEFDFNTCPQNNQVNYFYKTAGRRGSVIQVSSTINYGVPIEHDTYGRVRRVGNVFVNYDNRDRVNRIGSVYLKYNHFALNYIGGMQIVYNHCGEMINRVGRVNECEHYNECGHYNVYKNNHHDDYYKHREVAYRGSNPGNHYGNYYKKRK